jgi:hypothetical protein
MPKHIQPEQMQVIGTGDDLEKLEDVAGRLKRNGFFFLYLTHYYRMESSFCQSTWHD